MQIYVKLGVTLDLPDDKANDILKGNKNALLNVINNYHHQWWVAGETTIPVEGNEHTGIEDDIEFQI